MGKGSRSGRSTVVVGCQWGDEGKGKIVDVLTEGADLVARFQGGANAGHTVHVGAEQYILHQIPSGILHPGQRCLLGNGVVLDVVGFFNELDGLKSRGIAVDGRLGVSYRAQVLLPLHRALDQARETTARTKIGTTGRGIGPAYEDKVARRGLRVGDLADPARVSAVVADGLSRARATLAEAGTDMDALEADTFHALEQAGRLLGMGVDAGAEVWDALHQGKHVLLEGAQGTMLDVDHGTYPFVTSSNTSAAGAAVGIGIGPTAIDEVLGVLKAYTTRVGAGPLPSAFDAEMDEAVRALGGEFGATTGRPRRCGWFDAVVGRYAARVNGLTGLAITKLDVLDTLPELRIATAYRSRSGIEETFPASLDLFDREDFEPVYETLPGWVADTSGARTIEDLPPNARRYLDRIEELLAVPVEMVSVGTQRSQIIRVR